MKNPVRKPALSRKPTISSEKTGGRFSWLSKRSRILLAITATVLAVAIAAVSFVVPTLAAPTRQDAVNWANNQVGTWRDFDGKYGAQCVDFFNFYLKEVFGIDKPITAFPVSYAYQLPNYVGNVAGWQAIANYYDFIPQPGDIAIWSSSNSSPAGHVAVIVAADMNRMTTIGQNENYPYDGGNNACATKVTRGYNGFWGVIRPVFSTLSPASPPSSVSLSAANVGIGAIVTANWGAVSGATSYVVSLTCTTNSAYNQAAREVAGTSASFALSNAGTYKISVQSRNGSGNSSARDSGTIVVHPNVSVTFKDWDATTLKQQSVVYGGSATAPSAPSREGWTFQGWDKGFSSVTMDTVVTATYKINTYNVRFVDDKGVALGTPQTQIVKHGAAATPPSVTPPAGYKFVDWDSHDYELVKKDMTIAAVFAWENPNLPNITQIISAVRNTEASGYYVMVKLQNAPLGMVRGRVIVALKTASGKMVASATETYYLTELASSAHNVYVPYTGVATKVEVSVVGLLDDENTGVPLAQLASASIDLGLTWSDWSSDSPPAGGYVTESRDEYRYKDKHTTTSNSATLNGWTLVNTAKTGWGNWSNWATTPYSASSDREVQTQPVTSGYNMIVYITQSAASPYYRQFRSYSINSNYSGYGVRASYGEQGPYRYWVSKASLDGAQKLNSGDWCSGNTSGYVRGDGAAYYFGDNMAPSYIESATTATQWRYRDAVYTYTFEKWDDWSNWQVGTAPVASSNKQVETRLSYRYKSNGTDLLENNNGTVRSVSGNINAPGKLLTLLVFRQTNADPTASQLQYVAQTTIDTNGDYSFDYITKDEPTPHTGDFIVMVAVEGGTAPVYVETIKAPPRSYTVVFADDEGNELSRQVIAEGDNVVQPEAPVKEGYDFIGWNESTANIRKDLTIAAVLAKKTYVVVFNDWDGSEISIEEFEHGDILFMEDIPFKEGSTFEQWIDLNGDAVTTVTQNMVVSAKYTTNIYTLKFLDWDGTLIDEQHIPYSETATAPTLTSAPPPGMVFGSWSEDDALAYVTQDLMVYPIAAYPETVATPEISLESGNYAQSQTIRLSCATPNAKIIFTTDGSLPVYEVTAFGTIVEGIQYYAPITVSEDTFLVAMAFADGKNSSPLSVSVYEITGDTISYGDVNGDETVDIRDQQRLTQYLSGWVVEISPGADANGDGIVDIRDLQRLTQYLSGWPVSLGS